MYGTFENVLLPLGHFALDRKKVVICDPDFLEYLYELAIKVQRERLVSYSTISDSAKSPRPRTLL